MDRQRYQEAIERKFVSWQEACQGTSNPESKEKLQMQARTFFRSLQAAGASSSVMSDVGDYCCEPSLAKLLKTLGPEVTSSSFGARVSSLHTLCGALEGCRGFHLTLKTANLWASFFLEQCAPINDGGGVDYVSLESDHGEQVRDLSIKCLVALLKCQFQTKNSNNHIDEVITLHCSVSRQGMERRCALPDEDNDNLRGLGMDGLGSSGGVAGGLAILPRSRRSLCFDLLQAAVEGIEDTFTIRGYKNEHFLEKVPANVGNDVKGFVSFACQCLHGESDPRCLMQLLLLFRKIQVALEPLFSNATDATFPIIEMFDACAPYYPINFTPPQHDNHGMTRKGLHDALMNVLRGFEYDLLAAKENQDTMVSLSLGLILERLIPVEGGDCNLASSATEKRDALHDVSLLLFPDDEENDCGSWKLDYVAESSMQLLSNALIYTFQEASHVVSQGGPDYADDNKLLVDDCRSCISRVASSLESSKITVLWNVFVKDPVVAMSLKLATTSTEGPVAVAYLASLAAGGGPETLRSVLNAGLPRLINVLNTSAADKNEKSGTMAAYGIGAFASSCHVAMVKSKEKGLDLHPHPMDKFCAGAFEALYSVYTDAENSSLRMASVAGLESLLVITPLNLVNNSQKEYTTKMLSELCTTVLIVSDGTAPAQDNVSSDFAMACAKSLGRLLGKAVEESFKQDEKSSQGNDETILRSREVFDLLKGRIMADLLSRSTQASTNGDLLRYDRIALAQACSISTVTSKVILEALLLSLKDSLGLISSEPESREIVAALSFLFRNAGDVASRAFHALAPPHVNVYDVLDKLSELDPRSGKKTLDLPATTEEVEKINQMAHDTISLLLPAYENSVPAEHTSKLLCRAAKLLPPLSDSDAYELSITLPLLSASLESGSILCQSDPMFHRLVDRFASIRCDLAVYALSTEYEARSRSAAATCLHAYIAHFVPPESPECPAREMMKDVLVPGMLQSLDEMKRTGEATKKSSILRKFTDGVNLAATVGSAAALRGGRSTCTADDLASFFVQLACDKEARATDKYVAKEIDLVAIDGGSLSSCFPVRLSAVDAFGAMLNVQKPLWKQRLAHKTLSYLEPVVDRMQTNTNPGVESISLLALVCHLICSGELRHVSMPKRGRAVRLVVSSLNSNFACDENGAAVERALREVKRFAVASILFLSCSSPGLLSSYSEIILTGLLKAYAGRPQSDARSDIACKLLILQVLERLCHMEIRKKPIMVMKPVVVSILGSAMNHPSRLLREAAARVRNTWCCIE